MSREHEEPTRLPYDAPIYLPNRLSRQQTIPPYTAEDEEEPTLSSAYVSPDVVISQLESLRIEFQAHLQTAVNVIIEENIATRTAWALTVGKIRRLFIIGAVGLVLGFLVAAALT